MTMFEVPREVPRGMLDRVLSKETTNGTFLVLKKQELKDKFVLLIADGGSDLIDSVKDPRHCIVGICRCVISDAAARDPDVMPGAIIECENLEFTTAKTRERILKTNTIQVIGQAPDFENLEEARKTVHPWTKEDAVIPPPRQRQQKFAEEQQDTYSATRSAERRMTGANRSAPYRQTPGVPVARAVEDPVLNISELTAITSKWTIRARVIAKSDVREYLGKTGSGKLFSVDMIDSPNGPSVRATFWGQKAVENFYDLLKVDQVYLLSKGNVVVANKQYSQPGSHKFEIRFGDDANINLVDDDDSIPHKSFKFTPIAEMFGMEKGTVVDARGVVTRIGPTSQITIKSTGKTKNKREVVVVDESGNQIELTVWEPRTEEFDEALGEDVAADREDQDKILFLVLKAGKVDEYNGKRLGASFNSELSLFVYQDSRQSWIYPRGTREVPELESLRVWYKQHAKSIAPAPLKSSYKDRDEPRQTIREIQAEVHEPSNPEDLTGKGLWFTTLVSLEEIPARANNKKFYWEACPTCKKKVKTNIESDTTFGFPGSDFSHLRSVKKDYFCEACKKTVAAPDFKYNLMIDIQDHTGSLRCVAMAENGEAIMGVSCEDLIESAESMSGSAPDFSDHFTRALDKIFVMRLCAKSENYMDENRIKYRVYSAEPVESNVAARESPKMITQRLMQFI